MAEFRVRAMRGSCEELWSEVEKRVVGACHVFFVAVKGQVVAQE